MESEICIPGVRFSKAPKLFGSISSRLFTLYLVNKTFLIIKICYELGRMSGSYEWLFGAESFSWAFEKRALGRENHEKVMKFQIFSQNCFKLMVEKQIKQINK